MALKQKCAVCASWQWCGRPCRNAPAVIVSERDLPTAQIVTSQPAIAVSKTAHKPRLVAPSPSPGKEVTPKVTASKRGRPAGGKEQVTIRLDKDVLAKFKATGDGWQSRINEALRKATP